MRKLTWLGLFLVGAFMAPACDGDDDGPSGTGTTTTTPGTGGAGGGTGGAGGGTGGAGGTITPGVDGAPCMADGDCDGALCINEPEFGWPSGHCSTECETPGDACANGGVCTFFGVCLVQCAADPDCRDGYTCQDVFEDGTTYCYPQCTDNAQCPEVGTCDPNQGLCIGPEADCGDLSDNDGDDLIDCEDPTTCQGTAACTPGTGAVGTPCDANTDCAATGGDPACFSDAGAGWPMGYCTEFCDPVANDCGAGSTCVDAGLESGSGLCLDVCVTAADCRAGYICDEIAGGMFCMPECTDDAQCASFCNLDNGLCNPADEICDNGMDDDGDDRADCQDLDCGAICAPLFDAACMAAPAAGASVSGNTVGGTSLFASNCTGNGAMERLYTYDAPGPGTLTLTLSSATDQGVYVRTTCADPSTQLACRDVELGGTDEVLAVPIPAAQTVTIFVDAYEPGEEGPFTLTTAFDPSVCGDGTAEGPEQCDDGNITDGDGCDANCQVELAFYCSNAPAAQATNNGNTIGGTNAFDASCTGVGAPERIYTYLPSQNGMLTLTLNSAADLGLYVRSDCADEATEIDCVDAEFGGTPETLQVPVTANVPVTIFVDGYVASESGPYTLTVAFMP